MQYIHNRPFNTTVAQLIINKFLSITVDISALPWTSWDWSTTKEYDNGRLF